MIHSRTTKAVLSNLPWLWLFIGLLAGVPSSSEARSSFRSEYDGAIQKAVKAYWADFPEWQAWKAQLYQESALDPSARSGVGAVGLAQFMPGTWDDALRQLGLHGDRTSAELSIQAGAYYMAQLRRTWARGRDGIDRHDLAEASYNSGTGNILKAQRLCDNQKVWHDIAPCMARVTGPANAKQTTDYVTNIRKWWLMMESE